MDVKKLLSNTIIYLMKNNTIDRITVQDVLDKSGVARATFYKYFKDKMDLMMYPFFLFMDENFSTSDAINPDFYTRFFQYIKGNQKFFENAFKSEGQNSCEHVLHGYGTKGFEKAYLYSIQKDVAELTPEVKYWIEFYAIGAFAVVKKWVESGMKEPPQMISRLIYDCMPGTLREL